MASTKPSNNQNLQLSVKYQMKNYSFSNIAAEDSLIRNSTDLSTHYRHSELRAQQANQRIQEIKKKYDTPSRRQRIDSLKKSQDLQINPRHNLENQENTLPDMDRQSREDYYHRPAPNFGTNHLKESFAVNRLEKSTLRNDGDCRQLQNLRRDYRGEQKNISSYCREDEQALFSKVRQMKESLVNKDFMRGSINPRSSISSAKPQNEKTRCLDPRVQNIDKINSKIKQILSCLAENDKNPSKYFMGNPSQAPSKDTHEETILDTRKSFLKEDSRQITAMELYNRPLHKQSRSSFNSYKQKSIEQPKNYMLKQKEGNYQVNINQSVNDLYRGASVLLTATEPNQRTKGSRQIPLRESLSVNKFQQDFSRTPHHIHKYTDSKTPLQASRSRSQIASVHSVKDDTLKSGKKVNDEIRKFQSKIEAMQREKKMLNIQFTPFSTKNRSTSALLTGTYLQTTSVESEKDRTQSSGSKPLIPHFRSSSSTKDRIFNSQFGHHRFLQSKGCLEGNQTEINKQREVRQIWKQNQSSRDQRGQLSLDQVDVDIKTVRIQKEENINDGSITCGLTNNYREDFEQVRKRTDEGMLQRQKRLKYSHDQIIRSDSLKKLVSLFCEQAKLDQQLRNMKIWLQQQSDNKKSEKLNNLIKQQGIQLSPEQFNNTFNIEESQHNPFFSLQGFQGSFQGLIQAYLEAQRHWVTKIKGQFDRESLLSEGFTQNKMDLERKGFVELQDLVRLLNIESGTFYRNRDIYLIFKRLTGKERSSFQELLKELCP